MTNAWGRSRPLFFILSYYKMETIMARRNPHRACYTKKRKSKKLKNSDRWERNNRPWDHGTERESQSGYSLYRLGKGWV